MEKIKLNDLVQEEKKQNLICENTIEKGHRKYETCNEKLEFDLISGRYFCPRCDPPRYRKALLQSSLESQNKLTIVDFNAMEELDSWQLIRILKIRENSFNYLHHEWKKASKGDTKAQFFMSRLQETQKEIEKLKTLLKELEFIQTYIFNKHPEIKKEVLFGPEIPTKQKK
jgi:hypothetical protein